MPKKMNSAGKMQNYVPAGHGDPSGEYGDNSTGSNIHIKFDDGDGSDIIDKYDKEKYKTGVGIENIEPDKPIKNDYKEKYDGKGKDNLKQAIKNNFGKETPNVKKLFDRIKDADDELSGIIGDLYNNNPQIKIKLGKNLNSAYKEINYSNYWSGERWTEYSVNVGEGELSDDGNYSKGGVFFHESGHALDHSYIDDTGHKSMWSSYYKSKEFNKTLSEMIYSELEKYNDLDKFNEIKKETEKISNNGWFKYEQEYNDLQEKIKKYNNEVMNDPQVVKYTEKINVITDEIFNLRTKLFKINAYDVEFADLSKQYADKKQELLNTSKESSELQQRLYKDKFAQKEEQEKRRDELFNLKFELKRKNDNAVNIAYGDLSDMLQATTGKTLTGMGHNAGYFERSTRKRGTEAFAEIMSAKATNPESLKVLQKYIPNTLKIFDEIIGAIKNGK